MVCAHAAVIDATILVEQSDFKVAGVGYLCVAEQSRGQNLGRRIADIAMQEADRRKFDIGLLFTAGTLPEIYSPLGWKLIDKDFYYLENHSQKKLSADILRMYYPLNKTSFPAGNIYLQQNYW